MVLILVTKKTFQFNFLQKKGNLRRHVSTHYVYSEGSGEQLTCNSTKIGKFIFLFKILLDNCLKKYMKNENEVPRECESEMQSFKKLCGFRRGLNLQNIRLRNYNGDIFK